MGAEYANREAAGMTALSCAPTPAAVEAYVEWTVAAIARPHDVWEVVCADFPEELHPPYRWNGEAYLSHGELSRDGFDDAERYWARAAVALEKLEERRAEAYRRREAAKEEARAAKERAPVPAWIPAAAPARASECAGFIGHKWSPAPYPSLASATLAPGIRREICLDCGGDRILGGGRTGLPARGKR